MAKNTQTGSFLAKHFPTLFKHFSENASQEEFNKAEQEAAVVFQQNKTAEASEEVPAVDAALAALYPTSHQAVAAKLSAEEFKTFTADAQEIQNRLTAQGAGNQAVADDLTKANATLSTTLSQLATTTTALATANDTIKTLTPKAASWDAHKAALGQSAVTEDSTNTGKKKPSADSGLTTKDQKHLEDVQRLKATYPGLMADIDVPDVEA